MTTTDPIPDVRPSSKHFGWWHWSLTLKGHTLEGEEPTKADALRAAAEAFREWREAGDTEVIDLRNPPV